MMQNIKGTKDILPDEIGTWHDVERVIRRVCSVFNYDEIRTPIIEYSDLFQKSAGEGSDVVSKEMYSFKDRSDDSICLRPELTAPVARAVAQYTMLRANPTLRLWYAGACFRYERPQLGRQRQFHQVGAECIGSPHPEADAEIISLAQELIQGCGIRDYSLEINSLGSADSRRIYREKLIAYFTGYKAELSADSQRRLELNPLRILDSKDERDKEIIKGAPRLIEELDAPSLQHFERLQAHLKACGIAYTLNPVLVRGLDYYTHTVFEFKTTKLGAQDAIGGGGRYDNLFESLHAQAAPGVGFGIGLERLVLLCQSEAAKKPATVDCFVIADAQYTERAMELSTALRRAGLITRCDLQQRSFKAQLKEADKIGARVVYIIGENEFKSNSLTIKNMTLRTQQNVPYVLDTAVAMANA